MQIKLSDRTPTPMYFLGDPKDLVAVLSFTNPGPVEIDFNKLSRAEQGRVIRDIKSGILESNISFDQLYKEWTKSTSSEPEKPPPETQNILQAQVQRVEETRFRFEVKKQEKERKFNERCDFLIKGSIKAIKVIASREKDTSLLRSLIIREQQGKKRKMVLSILEKRYLFLMKRAQEEISKKIAKSSQQQLKGKRYPGETILMDVIESEQETIILTPEELIAAATDESVGGE